MPKFESKCCDLEGRRFLTNKKKKKKRSKYVCCGLCFGKSVVYASVISSAVDEFCRNPNLKSV